MGLCNLAHIDTILARRKEQSQLYDRLLSGLPLQKPSFRESTEYNYSYFPILLADEATLLKVIQRLELHSIFPRRYFFLRCPICLMSGKATARRSATIYRGVFYAFRFIMHCRATRLS